jgi:alkanesulfonate monooxygenase SsuD/methylene tetrahydromethanopterin reductase-like flavin-dependent oxidoreductase (luciferase family)
VIVGGFGPKMAALAGRVADGINLPGGPGLARLVGVARAARASSGRDPSSLVVTASSNLSTGALRRLEDFGVDRAVALVQAPFADHVRRLGASRR